MKTMTRKILTGLLILEFVTITTSATYAQTKGELVLPESSVTVKGTSSLHDWEVFINNYKVDFTVEPEGNEKIKIENLNAVFEGASVSSESSLMTSKAQDALKVKDFPEIVFTPAGTGEIIIDGDNTKKSIPGELKIAGVSKKYNVTFSGSISGKILTITGSNVISMGDFQIKPPTAMLGALKTGDQVTIEFNLKFRLD